MTEGANMAGKTKLHRRLVAAYERGVFEALSDELGGPVYARDHLEPWKEYTRHFANIAANEIEQEELI